MPQDCYTFSSSRAFCPTPRLRPELVLSPLFPTLSTHTPFTVLSVLSYQWAYLHCRVPPSFPPLNPRSIGPPAHCISTQVPGRHLRLQLFQNQTGQPPDRPPVSLHLGKQCLVHPSHCVVKPLEINLDWPKPSLRNPKRHLIRTKDSPITQDL